MRSNTAAVSEEFADAQQASGAPARSHQQQTSGSLDLLRTDGYVVLEDLISSSTLAQVCGELEPWFNKTPTCRGDFYGWKTTRTGSVLLKSPSSHELLLHPAILSLADAVLGPHCDWYQLNLTQAIRIHPGERQQAPHRDEEMWPCAKHGVEYLINVMWALSDFTAENGATMLWPGSQFESLRRDVDPNHAVIAQMQRGSALIFLGSLTHCAGANRSPLPRTGLIFSYSLGWLKQYENAFLSYPPAIAKTFAPRVRELLGYRIHRPNLGGYEGQDPAVLFDTDSHALPAIDCVPEDIALQLKSFYHAS